MPGRNGYIGDAARIVCDPTIWDAMGRFTQPVRHGGTVLNSHAESAGQKFWDSFALHSAALAAPSAEYVAALLGRFMEERPHSRILDLACGSGLYGLTLARKFHHARVTLLDRASVLAPARRRTKETAVHERVEVLAADMFDADLGGPYDVVVASHVLHLQCRHLRETPPPPRESHFPGGRLIVTTTSPTKPAPPTPPRRCSPRSCSPGPAGNTYTYSEYTKLFTRGGFLAPVMPRSPNLTTQFLVGERRPAGRGWDEEGRGAGRRLRRGVHRARRRERTAGGRGGVKLIARENYSSFFTPFCTEIVGGAMEVRHATAPLREILGGCASFLEASVEKIDLDARRVEPSAGPWSTTCW